MPNGSDLRKEFEKKLLEWESKAVLYEEKVKPLEERGIAVQEQLALAATPEAFEEWAKKARGGVPSWILPMWEMKAGMGPVYKLAVTEPLQAEYKSIQQSLLKDIFYIDIYRTVPVLVMSGAVSSVDEALSMLAIPDDLSAIESADVREVISDMLVAKAAGEPLEPAEVEEIEGIVYPELVAPAPVTGVPVSIHSLSTQDIIKSLKTPIVPESAMTEAEWKEYLAELGWSPEDIDNETQIRADQLVNEVLNRKSQIEQWRGEVAEMPEYRMGEFLKELVIQPPLAVLEALGFYYEHVSMPAAGWLFSKMPWEHDLNRLYNEFKAANPESTEREAYVYAWQQWEAPGPPVLDFILKYIIMEGIVDPLSYMGWGLATKLTKGLGPVGRLVGAAERGVAEILEMPFDFIKWGIKTAIPKTATQRAAVTSRELGRTIDSYLTKTIGKPLSFVQMDELSDAAGLAIKHFVDNPRSEDDIARAGLAMCTHSPVDDVIVKNWVARLKAAGLTTFSMDEITSQTLKDIDDIFERVFFKEVTADEMAPMLLLKLGVTAPTDDAAKLAARLLSQRYDRIITNASKFTMEKSPLGAMRAFMGATQKALRIAEVSKAAFAARQSGRLSTLLYDVPTQLQKTWTNQIDKWVVRPAAQSYLTFGMYGPMNVAEDIWRSFLGGVRPGRATIEQLDIEAIGLRIDPELRIWGMSDMIGPLKQTAGQPTRNNWILTIGMSPLSLPTYAATRGKVTPARFARGTYKYLVEMFGGIGMDMRRNFIVGRNRQLLAEAGGDAYQALAKAGPKELPPEVTLTWLRKEVNNQVYRAKVTGTLNPENPAFVDALKARFSRERVTRGEVTNIVSRYPDISDSSRNLVTQLYDEGALLRSADDIDRTMRQTVWANEVDDFLKGPEVAVKQYQQLTDLLKTLEVRSPEDMAHLIQSVTQMSKTYGAMPRQIMGRATVKSRGLPLAERRTAFDIDFDRIHTFMDKAGANIDDTIDKIRLTMREPTRAGKVNWDEVSLRVGDYADEIKRLVDELPMDIKLNIREIRFDARLKGKLAHFNAKTKSIVLRDKDSISSLYHEIGHSISDDFFNAGDYRVQRGYAGEAGVEYFFTQLKRLKAKELKPTANLKGLSDYDILYRYVPTFKTAEEDFARSFSNWIRGKGSGTWKGFFEEWFPKTQRALPLTEGYMGAADNVLDIMTASREYATTYRTQNIATRHEIFTAASPADMKSTSFWDDFYLTMDNEASVFNKQMAELNGRLTQSLQRLNEVAGAKMPVRPKVVVKNRPLAPNDVARLMQNRNDEVSRMLLDVLTAEGDKDFFVEYIMGLVREGYDVGFTRESVGAVYDQIAYSMKVDPNSSSWLRSREIELDSMTRDLHGLYNSKLLPDEQVAAIGKYIDDTAEAAGKVMYEAAPERLVTLGPISPAEPGVYEVMLKGRPITGGAVQTRVEGKSLIVSSLEIGEPKVVNKEFLASLAESLDNLARSKDLSELKIGFLPRHRKMYESVGFRQGITELEPGFMIRDVQPPKAPPTRVKKPEFANYDDLRQSAWTEAEKWYYKEYPDYTNANAFDAMMKSVYPFWCTPEHATALTKTGWKHYSELRIGEDLLTVNPETLVTEWQPLQDLAVFDYDDELMVIPAKGKDIEFTPNHRWLVVNKWNGHKPTIKRGYQLTDQYDLIPRALDHKFPDDSVLAPRDAAILGWVVTDGYYQRYNGTLNSLIIYQSEKKYLDEIVALTGGSAHPRAPDSTDWIIRVKREDRDRISSVCCCAEDIIDVVPRLSKEAAEAMWSAMMKAEGNTFTAYNGNKFSSFKQNPGRVMDAFQMLSVLLGKAITASSHRVNLVGNNKPYQAKEVRRLRKKHYKGKVWCPVTPNGTWFMNCNGSIVPTGNTYESQRWFWLPRSFVRHPGTLTAQGRYQKETEYGYFHFPGTAVDWRPVSGSIYGPWVSLMRRDYPEYYDSLEGAQGLVEFSDMLQRYGFYPNIIIGAVQAAFGGREQQLGGVLPAAYSGPLNTLIATFPDNELITFISEKIFPNRFRDYLIGRRVSDLGGDGSLLFAKKETGQALTPEEEDIWTTARSSAAAHAAAFENFGMFRMRSDKSYAIYEAAAKFIEQEFGYTPEQQKQLRLHGYSLWDIVGGLDPWQTEALQALEYWKYSGSVRPLLPSAQQEILNKIETDWADVKRHSETMQLEILDLQQDFLVGTERGKLGPSQFLSRVRDLFGKRKDYVDEKVEANPLMLLENRTEYYEKYRQPMPAQSPYKELMSMYFNVELEDTVDEATGERIYDWDKFWATRAMIDTAVADEDKADWDAYIGRNTAPIMKVWYEVYDRYFRKYYSLWEATLETYPENERELLKEFFYLERMGTDLARQAAIKDMVSSKTDNKLVSSFRSDVSDNRAVLRYTNPTLDAWLYYWDRVSSFKTPQAEPIFRQICKDTGREIK